MQISSTTLMDLALKFLSPWHNLHVKISLTILWLCYSKEFTKKKKRERKNLSRYNFDTTSASLACTADNQA
jgi:hypothetical protein